MIQKIEADLWEEFEEEINKVSKISAKVVFPSNADHKEFWNKFLTEKFPTGGLNKVLEKNLAIWILHNKLDIETIKAKYTEQGWKSGALLGWIKKASAGEILEYNVGELVNWAKEYNPKLLELLRDKEETQPIETDFNVIWEKDLSSYEGANVEWTIEGLIPRKSVGVLTGKRSTFKSFLSINASCCVASGKDFLGRFKTEKGKVLYLDKENGTFIMSPRVEMNKKGLNIEEELDIGFICFSQLKVDKNLDLWALEEVIEKEGINLLVIDTYRRAISFDENSAGEVSKLFVDGLRPLVEKHNLSILLIHHDKKGGENSGDEMDQIRGSSDLANYCDFILKSERKGKNIILKQLKCRNAVEINPVEISINTDEETFISFESKGDYVQMSAEERCSEDLIIWIEEKKVGDFKTKEAQEIVFSKGYKKQIFFNALKRLESSGIIEKKSQGFWEVLDENL